MKGFVTQCSGGCDKTQKLAKPGYWLCDDCRSAEVMPKYQRMMPGFAAPWFSSPPKPAKLTAEEVKKLAVDPSLAKIIRRFLAQPVPWKAPEDEI